MSTNAAIAETTVCRHPARCQVGSTGPRIVRRRASDRSRRCARHATTTDSSGSTRYQIPNGNSCTGGAAMVPRVFDELILEGILTDAGEGCEDFSTKRFRRPGPRVSSSS